MMLDIIPTGHHILVKPDDLADDLLKDAESLKKMGFEISDPNRTRMSKVSMGTVTAVGKNAWKGFDDGHAWAEVGDRVYFAEYGGKLIEHPETGEKLRLLNDEDITAVVREVANDG